MRSPMQAARYHLDWATMAMRFAESFSLPETDGVKTMLESSWQSKLTLCRNGEFAAVNLRYQITVVRHVRWICLASEYDIVTLDMVRFIASGKYAEEGVISLPTGESTLRTRLAPWIVMIDLSGDIGHEVPVNLDCVSDDPRSEDLESIERLCAWLDVVPRMETV